MKSIIKKVFQYLGIVVTKKRTIEGFKIEEDNQLIKEAQKKFGSITSLMKVNKIIDVGSNEGQFASACELVFEDAEYYCFEPLQDVFTLLSNKYSSNPQFKLFNFGLGKKNSSTIINRNEYSPSSSILEMNNIHKQNFDFAQFTSIQEINLPYLKLMFKVMN
jgi:FkbM family methyltransferase